MPLFRGDHVSLYNARLRLGRTGEPELHAGTGGFVVVSFLGLQEEIGMEGTVIVTREGTFLDDGKMRFLISGTLPHGHEVRIQGVQSGERIAVSSSEDIEKDVNMIQSQLRQLLSACDPTNTFTLHGRQDI
jgi:hypothetical protein